MSTGSKTNEAINNLILRFREGDSEAGEELLIKFRPLIRKYWTALWLGKVTNYDSELGRFLGFFNKDRRMAAELLSKSLHRSEVTDLEQILSYALLKTALQYNKISVCYKFVLKEEIANITKDVSAHRTTQTWDFNGPPDELGKLSNSYTSVASSNSKSGDDMDTFVLEGSEICGFNSLSRNERIITKMAYYDDMDNKDIATAMNLTVRQVRRARQRIREKIRCTN